METKKEMAPLPKWFNGDVYEKGGEVTNPFSGESYELNANELSMYDLIMGASMLFELGMYADSMVKDHRRGLQWFRVHNPEAYMVLLD
jgi:hypothetical protein